MIEGVDPPVYSKDDFKGAWDEAPADVKKRASHLTACCYVRDGHKYPDGSVGTVAITNGQLLDYLTFIISGEERV